MYLDQGQSIRQAVPQVIEEYLQSGILVDILTRCRTGVVEVLLTEYNEAETMEYLRREAQEIGLEQGLEQGIRILTESCQKFGISRDQTIENLCEKYELSRKQAEEYIKIYWK